MNDNNSDILYSVNRILILAPHPDDESIGCGGTVAQYTRTGKEVYVVVISKGDAVDVKIDNIVDIRKEETYKACEILGVKRLVFMDFPDTALNKHYDEVKQRIRDVIQTYNPDIVFSPSPMDRHDDHVVVSKIAFSLLKELCSFKVAFYEVYSPIRYNCIIDITDTMDIKERATLCYRYGLLEKPDKMFHAIKGLNAYRSFDSMNSRFFEVFYIVGADVAEDEIIDWLTYGLSREASSYKFLSEFKKTDHLLLEYKQSLEKICELNSLIKDREKTIEELKEKLNDNIKESYGFKNGSSLHKIRDKFFPYETKRRQLYDIVVKKIKSKM